MPHNNRMTTSATLKTSDIWSKTIGHDPYANQAEAQPLSSSLSSQQDMDTTTAAKMKTVMAMARNQNVTDGSNREGFTAKLYLGLKQGKVRRRGDVDAATTSAVDPKLQQLLEDPDSSSEDEFVEVAESQVKHEEEEDRWKKKKVSRKSKKRKKKKRSRHSSDDDDSSSSSSSGDSGNSDDDSSYEKREQRRRREKRKRSKKKKHHTKQSHEDSDSDSEGEKKKRSKRKRHRKESQTSSKASKEMS